MRITILKVILFNVFFKENSVNLLKLGRKIRDFLSPAMIMLDLDRLANEKKLSQPLNDIISNDVGVFGVDEELASAISMIYGPIGITNFGYLDRVKKGIIAQIDHDPARVNTFLDDLVGAIVAASCGKISHDYA